MGRLRESDVTSKLYKKGDQMKSLSVKLGVILVGLLIFGCAGMRETHWRVFDLNDEEIRYYYVEGIKHLTQNIVRVWVKVEYTDKGVMEKVQKLGKNYEDLKYTMMEEEINCLDKKWRDLSLHHYSKGEKVISSSSRAGHWNQIVSSSAAETLLKAVCK
jgi:hypothetical protein